MQGGLDEIVACCVLVQPETATQLVGGQLEQRVDGEWKLAKACSEVADNHHHDRVPAMIAIVNCQKQKTRQNAIVNGQ